MIQIDRAIELAAIIDSDTEKRAVIQFLNTVSDEKRDIEKKICIALNINSHGEKSSNQPNGVEGVHHAPRHRRLSLAISGISGGRHGSKFFNASPINTKKLSEVSVHVSKSSV